MSVDKCPVCGESEWVKWSDESGERYGHYKFGFDPEIGQHCDSAARLALERAAEIERLKASHARLIALCRRMSALPGDYNLIQDAEFVFRDLREAIARETLNEPKPQEK